jgi:membrane protease YdiL (CAAX protease family)
MRDDNLTPSSAFANRLLFAFVVVGSLVLTAVTNRLSGWLLNAYAPSLAWIATAAIPSALVIVILFWRFGDRHTLMWPKLGWDVCRRVLLMAGLWLFAWLVGSAVVAQQSGHWVTYARGLPLIAAFIVCGPLGEELLFRGLVFERARRLWPASAGPAMIISTLAFSLHHIALNAAPDSLMMAQIFFTIPMGLVMAWLRERTGSIWPGWLLHVATNLPAVL